MRWVRNFWRWVRSWFIRQPRAWTTRRIDDIPERPADDVVYLVGEGKFLWFVAFLCPCGCGESVQLNLLPDASPQWSVTEHPDGTVTLSPSVWRTKGCQSHFFVRRGLIVWC